MDQDGSGVGTNLAGPTAAGHRRPARFGEDREQEILRAAYELLGEVGYDGLRFDAVATRAKASKATLYRHWSSKAELVAEAVRTCKAEAHQLPDTGTLRGDLIAVATMMADGIASEDGPVFCAVAMAMRSDPAFAREMRETFEAKRAGSELIVARAVARGELRPDCDPHLIQEIAPAVLFVQSIARGEAADAAYIEHLVDDILLPLLTR